MNEKNVLINEWGWLKVCGQNMNPLLVPLHLGWSREVAPKKNAAGQVEITRLL
jgi:hypothetical protein